MDTLYRGRVEIITGLPHDAIDRINMPELALREVTHPAPAESKQVHRWIECEWGRQLNGNPDDLAPHLELLAEKVAAIEY